MMSIFIIKTALLRFGVVVQEIKFDIDNECINVNYTLHGKDQTKSVPFSQIEALFTSDSEGQAGPGRPFIGPPGHHKH